MKGQRGQTGAVLLALAALALLPQQAWATWPVIALDRATGRTVMTLASCVDVDAVIVRKLTTVMVPGKGVAACQAAVDSTMQDQTYVFQALERGEDPAAILAHLQAGEHYPQRQYGILDIAGRGTGGSGSSAPRFAKTVHGQVPGTQIFYAIQGNVVTESTVPDAVRAFVSTPGSLPDRALAAMEAGDRAGGDTRCKCPPASDQSGARCDEVHSRFAFLVMAGRNTPVAARSDAQTFTLELYVSPPGRGTDPIDVAKGESLDPVRTLRIRYDAWRKAHPDDPRLGRPK